MQVDTPHGPALVRFTVPDGAFAPDAAPARAPQALLALGHGAGGDVTAPDLVAVRKAVLSLGIAVAMITQPYRVAGRRAPAPAAHLDAAWLAALAAVPRPDVPLLVGGRSSGARVACRTAAAVGAAGVVALAFPVHPPGRPENSRLPELDTGLPTLAVSGERDPFGIPPEAPGRRVVIVPGAVHSLRDTAAVARAVVDWLRDFLGPQGFRDSA